MPWDREKPDETPPPPKDGRARPAPGTENRLAFGDYLQRELAVADERIGPAPPAIERFLEERDGEISAIESVLLNADEPRWELDVTASMEAPMLNLAGAIRLQRLLMTRALLLARSGSPDAAVETMEASWRLHDAFLSRPDLLSQIIAIGVARLQAGVLRKIDSPAYGWSDRLRSGGGPLAAYEAAFQNEAWIIPRGLEGWEPYALEDARSRSRYLENLGRRSLCEWSSAVFDDARDEAAVEIVDVDHRAMFLQLRAKNFPDGLLRARRAAIDSELTALILDARAERAALRTPRWPAKLLTRNAGVCPEAVWSYRVERNGTARFRFDSRFDDTDSSPMHLPLEFTAGKPLKRRPAKKGVVVNPPPPAR
jgi:hypothetical protein